MTKHKHDLPKDKPEAEELVTESPIEKPIGDDLDEHDIESKKLSEIESTEVSLETNEEAVVDPDKEISIKKPAVQSPWWKRRNIVIPAGIALLIVIILLIPFGRFALLGWVWRENVTVTIVDASSKAPVTDAVVSLAGKESTTDSRGKVTLQSVAIGYHTLQVTKANYTTLNAPLTVDIFSSGQDRSESFVATGRPLDIAVTDRLTGKPIADGTFSDAKGAKLGRTDGRGHATVVLPVNKKELTVSVAAGGYRVLSTKVDASTKSLQLVPEGALYFLSKQSGKIDVVKSGLDGSDRKVVVAGTGDENNNTTALLASQDWKYLILKSKRAPNKPESLFIIDTATNTMKVVDEGNISLSLIGWSGHRFLYSIERENIPAWQQKRTAVKSYDAEKGSLATLDESTTDPTSSQVGYTFEQFNNYYILDNTLVYTKVWQAIGFVPPSVEGKQSAIVAVKPDGTGKKALKTFSAPSVAGISASLFEPQEVYYTITDNSPMSKITYGEYEGGVYKDAKEFDQNKSYPTFLMSPSGNESFWYEERDGKNILFVGDKNAGNKQELAAKTGFKPYGWLTDKYLLLQKSDSELYITTKELLKAGGEPLKVSDYHKPKISFEGYGYGYGGL